MADHADEDNDWDIFVYRGGRAPQHVTHVRIDKSVDEIEDHAFYNCERLVKVETHDGIRKVGESAFENCGSLPQINLKSVVEIGKWAFYGCENLADVEFGDELEAIRNDAFQECTSLTHLKLPSIVTIGVSAFHNCDSLIDIELSERLEAIEGLAFWSCERLRRIAIPLKRNILEYDNVLEGHIQFDKCEQLTTVDLVGGIHKTVVSLHMDSWRNDMITEINRINGALPNTPSIEKTEVIVQWMELVLDKFDHYKAEHCRFVKEGLSLLELALWKSKLGENEEHAGERGAKKAKIDTESARKGGRITCGADTVIKNVLPFLRLE